VNESSESPKNDPNSPKTRRMTQLKREIEIIDYGFNKIDGAFLDHSR
jgi:hypothetical protein